MRERKGRKRGKRGRRERGGREEEREGRRIQRRNRMDRRYNHTTVLSLLTNGRCCGVHGGPHTLTSNSHSSDFKGVLG